MCWLARRLNTPFCFSHKNVPVFYACLHQASTFCSRLWGEPGNAAVSQKTTLNWCQEKAIFIEIPCYKVRFYIKNKQQPGVKNTLIFIGSILFCKRTRMGGNFMSIPHIVFFCQVDGSKRVSNGHQIGVVELSWKKILSIFPSQFMLHYVTMANTSEQNSFYFKVPLR